MIEKELIILGAGSYGAIVKELAELNDYKVNAFYDDNEALHSKSIHNIPIVGKIDLNIMKVEGLSFAIAIGNSSIRRYLCEQIIQRGGVLPTLIHPNIEISRYSKIGKGCFIHAFAYIWTEVEINNYSIISPKVVVAHHSKIGCASFISTGVNIGAGININDEVFVGIGSTIMTGVKSIGKNAFIGAGSVIIKDVPDNAVVVGNPGRILRFIASPTLNMNSPQ